MVFPRLRLWLFTFGLDALLDLGLLCCQGEPGSGFRFVGVEVGI
jgi:hypothetical protein